MHGLPTLHWILAHSLAAVGKPVMLAPSCNDGLH
jgi:hypothetical protein